LLDVVVADDAAAARAALERWRNGAARELPAVTGLGHAACGTTTAVGFARDNIMIAGRRVAGDADVAAIARAADRAVAAAATGSPFARPAAPARLDDLAVGATAIVAPAVLPAVLAAELSVRGPARARRTGTAGWRVTRTGAGRVTTAITLVDDRLRVAW
jgi:hypothetical protein